MKKQKRKLVTKKKSKPFIRIYFKPRRVRELLKFHNVEQLKFVSFQLVDLGLDAMKDFKNKDCLKWIVISDKDIIF